MQPETSDKTYSVTFTFGLHGTLTPKVVTQSELWQRLTTHVVVEDKKKAEALIPAEFAICPTPCRNAGTSKANCGGGTYHRLADNVRSISLFVVDLDKLPQAAIDLTLQSLDHMGLAYVYATTFSHRPPEECSARLFFPLSKPYAVTTAKHWKSVVWPTLMRLVGFDPESPAVKADRQCSDASRLYFLPSVENDNSPRMTIVREGRPIDTDALPVAAPKPHMALVAPINPSAVRRDASRDTVLPLALAAAERPDDVELLAAVADGRGFPEGTRHPSLLRVTWLLAKHCNTYSDETLLALLAPTVAALGDDEDWTSKAEGMLAGARNRLDEQTAEDIAFEALLNEQRGDGKGYASRFVRLYGDRVRCTDATGFLVWDGKCWTPDPNGSRVLSLGAEMSNTYENDLDVLKQTFETLNCQFLALGPEQTPARSALAQRIATLTKRIEKFRATVITPCRQTHSIQAFINQTRTALSVSAEAFDADPWLLNCQNGSIDLKTGALLPNDPKALCMKLASTEYSPDAHAPLFERTLEQALPDPEVRAFFQRAIGYALTGCMSEDLIFILLGSGGNGKSTLLNAIANALGDYAGPAPKSLLMTSKVGGTQSYELADLRGKRLVTMMELSQREYMDSSRLKSVVGGDRIMAARKYENQIAFTTQAKIFMPCNAKPRLNDDDAGAWRRLALIEFPAAFLTDDVRIRELPERLKHESAGILAWAVRGCLEWQRGGLQVPEVCRNAVNEYRHEENYVARFVEDRVERGEGTVTSSRIYDAYREWSQGEGVQPLSHKGFSMKLQKLGFETYRTTAARMYRNVKSIIA